MDPRGPWKQMARNLPYWLEDSSPGGFAMDWVQCNLTSCQAIPGPGNATGAPRGSYDAIRVYLWAGIANKDTPGNKRLLKIFSPMLDYMKTHPQPPESVAPTGAILGASGPTSFAASLIPFAFNSGEYALTSRLRQRATASISPSTGLLGNPARY